MDAGTGTGRGMGVEIGVGDRMSSTTSCGTLPLLEDVPSEATLA